MTNKKKRPSIFISHSLKDEGISQKLKNKLIDNGFDVITDDQSLCYKGSIYDYINEKIDNSLYFIILISDEYLKSKHCMFEFSEISRNKDFSRKCFPLIIKNANLFSHDIKSKYIYYWNNEIQNIENKIKSKVENSGESNLLWYDFNLCSNNKYKIFHLFDYLNEMNPLEVDENIDEQLNGLTNAIETKSKIDNQKALDGDENS